MRHTHTRSSSVSLKQIASPWKRCPQNFSLSFILSQSLSIISALVFPSFSHPLFYSLRLSRSMYVAALPMCLPEESYPSLFANNATSLKAAHFSVGPSEAGLSLRQTALRSHLSITTPPRKPTLMPQAISTWRPTCSQNSQRGIAHTTQALNKHFLNASTTLSKG